VLIIFYHKRYTKGIFPKDPGPTIGVEYATKTILLNEG